MLGIKRVILPIEKVILPMSVRVNVCNIPNEVRTRMAGELVVKQAETQSRRNPPTIYPYTVSEEDADGKAFGSFPFA